MFRGIAAEDSLATYEWPEAAPIAGAASPSEGKAGLAALMDHPITGPSNSVSPMRRQMALGEQL
jgi:hypothetical protein